MPDPIAVNRMFARIAGRYDLANRLTSFGIDRSWRRRLVAAVQRQQPRDVLDLATGSGDVAFALSRTLAPTVPIIGMDFCRPMLDEAETKKQHAGGYANVTFQEGDALNLPLPSARVDAITIAFGLRNTADRGRALQEMLRVLRPAGRAYILEFSQPKAGFRPLYFFYLRHVLPRLAAWITGAKDAYDYLGGSISSFPHHQALAEELRQAGFAAVTVERMTFGTVALHIGTRSAPVAVAEPRVN